MSNKGKHTSKKPFGSRFDARPQKTENRKINRDVFEKDDIELSDDVDLPKEHEIPVLSNSSSKKNAEALKTEDNKTSSKASSNKSNKSKQNKGKHVKSKDNAADAKPSANDDNLSNKNNKNEKKNKSDSKTISKTKSGKHSSEALKASQSLNDSETKKDDKRTDDTDNNDNNESNDSADTSKIEEEIPSSKETINPSEQKTEQDDDSANPKTFDIKGKKFFEKHPKAKKKILIACGSFLGAVVAIYLIGVAFFSLFMYPNSNIENIDTSIKTPVPIQQELNSLIENYSFTVKGQGMDTKVSSQDAGIVVDYEKVTNDALNSQNAWLWPYEIFLNHDNTQFLKDAITINSLSELLTADVDNINASAVHPTNAYIQFVPDKATFEIVPEIPGSILDPEKVVEHVAQSVTNLDTAVTLGDDTLLEPTVLSDDKRLLQALNEANSTLTVNPQLNLNGVSVYTIDPSVIGPWVVVGEDFTVSFNPDSMSAWSDEISKQFNTVGKQRTYTRPDGKVVTVSGGTYGWKVDTDDLINRVNEAFASKTSSAIEIPVKQSGTGYDANSGRDWGARYVDIDLAEQHARFYDANGALIWESPIVSGAQGKTDTPTGVYTLNSKGTNVTLRGPMKNGEYEWDSEVKYWMPFKGNSVGLHDASWQSAFGGSRFKQGFGSHGCVNLPTNKAGELYKIIKKGDVVVVHY